MAQDFSGEQVGRFRSSISSGENWYLALLEAARSWPVTEETVENTCYRYLIAGEAFDLTQLAERLIDTAKDLIPEREQINFLFKDKPPLHLSPDELRERLGEEKYKQHLNFFYGVTVEETLLEAASEDIRKEERGVRARSDSWISAEAYLRIYGKTQPDLTLLFQAEKGFPESDDFSLTEMKELTYWLFRYRLTHSDPEKSASDTKKALAWLKKHGK
jgi:hypothetical protein